MESEELTLDFVKAMIEYFRDEKLIHKKFVYRVMTSNRERERECVCENDF